MPESARIESPDRLWAVVFALAITPLVAATAILAVTKPFWHDEICTILFADLPSIAVMWRAAHNGIDLAPPLNAIVTHGIHLLSGGPARWSPGCRHSSAIWRCRSSCSTWCEGVRT